MSELFFPKERMQLIVSFGIVCCRLVESNYGYNRERLHELVDILYDEWEKEVEDA